MTIDKPKKSFSIFEKHYQTIVISGSMALMLWVGMTVNNSQNQIGVLNNDIAHLSVQVNKIEAKINGRYRAEDARRDFQLRDQQIKSLFSQVSNLRIRQEKTEEKIIKLIR